MKDNFGREYLKLKEAKASQMVELDGDFTCHKAGPVRLYSDEKGNLYFLCRNGQHFIDGQADDGIHCIGIYKAETEV